MLHIEGPLVGLGEVNIPNVLALSHKFQPDGYNCTTPFLQTSPERSVVPLEEIWLSNGHLCAPEVQDLA